ncbi:MAG: hypothetical protein RL189_573 [Pseudomonadota bacterium]|jgi:hypothetical protein
MLIWRFTKKSPFPTQLARELWNQFTETVLHHFIECSVRSYQATFKERRYFLTMHLS